MALGNDVSFAFLSIEIVRSFDPWGNNANDLDARGRSDENKAHSDNSLVHVLVARWDRWLTVWLRDQNSGWSGPFGRVTHWMSEFSSERIALEDLQRETVVIPVSRNEPRLPRWTWQSQMLFSNVRTSSSRVRLAYGSDAPRWKTLVSADEPFHDHAACSQAWS